MNEQELAILARIEEKCDRVQRSVDQLVKVLSNEIWQQILKSEEK